MAVIGNFRRSLEDNIFSGFFECFSMKVELKLVPFVNQRPFFPTHIVVSDKRRVGYARSNNRNNIEVIVDDPCFSTPVCAELIADHDDPENFSLVWCRPGKEN